MKFKKQIENEKYFIEQIQKLYWEEDSKCLDKLSPTAKAYVEKNEEYVKGIKMALDWVLSDKNTEDCILSYAHEFEKIKEMREKDGV